MIRIVKISNREYKHILKIAISFLDYAAFIFLFQLIF